VVVKSGELTLYRGDDPTCTPTRVPAGSGFVDDGGDVHMVRNEGTVETVVYVTSLVPSGAPRRIDEPSRGTARSERRRRVAALAGVRSDPSRCGPAIP
jgi:hypothetical protein